MAKTIKMVLIQDCIKGKTGKEIEAYTERGANALERNGWAKRIDPVKQESSDDVTNQETVIEEDMLGLNEPTQDKAATVKPVAANKKSSNSHKK